MKAVIIAGGKGTRLGLTDVPKPMARIGDRTLLEHQFELLRRYGLKDVYILSGHLADAIFDRFHDGSDYGLRVTHLVEPRALGTAGSIGLLKHLLHERFLVLYGDVLLDMDLERLIAFDRREESVATLVVHPNNHPVDSDLVEVDEDGFIVAFHSKPRPPDVYYHNLVNAGVYILSPEIFSHIDCGPSLDFGRDVLPELLRKGQRLRGYRTAEYLSDMGTPERLRLVTRDFLSGRVARLNRCHKRPAIFLDRDGVLIRDVDNLSRSEDVQLLPGVGEAVARINASDYLAVVATNQPMIAKGFLTTEGLRGIHKKLETLLGREHAFVDALYYCPHHPDSGFPGEVRELKGPCLCRKPSPGMLLKAAEDWNIDLARSWMIGDRESDQLAGKRAGCTSVHLCAEGTASRWADHSAASLLESVNGILGGAFRPQLEREAA
ncbi:MAG TPA: HAD-IIIA family hydrolase [Gemmataceae bacterium]|nr:HAD-IIIA family hydrolase [Gemmataceae bacterium]